MSMLDRSGDSSMLVEIESYEEFKEQELKFHSAFSKNTYITESKDGRELLYSGGTCQITDLRKSYEKYCKRMEDVMERVKKFKEWVTCPNICLEKEDLK